MKKLFNAIANIEWSKYILLLIFITICIPSTLVNKPYLGLDGSWWLTLNHALLNHLTFGTDYILTYGPWGIFETRYGAGIPKFVFILFDVWTLTLSVIIFWYLQSVIKNKWHLVFLIFLFWLTGSGNSQKMLFLFILYILLGLQSRKIFPLIIAATIAYVGFFIKLNSAFLYPLLLLGSSLFFLLRRQLKITSFLLINTIFSLSVFMTAFLFNVNLVKYFQSGFQIISGYVDAMSLTIIYVENSWIIYKICIALAFVLMFCYLVLFFTLKVYKSIDFVFIYLLLGFSIFLSFKTWFTRLDGRGTFFFPYFLLHLFALYVFVRRENYKPNVKLFAFGFILLLFSRLMAPESTIGIKNIEYFKTKYQGISLNNFLNYKIDYLSDTWVVAKNIASNLLYSLAPIEYINDVSADIQSKCTYSQEEKNLRRLPDKLLDTLKNQSVDLIPCEISYIFINNLNYNPRPICQSYVAYNEYLDTKNYDKYKSASAPDFVLFSMLTLDMRQPFWDESITKRALIENYEIVDTFSLKAIGEKYWLNFEDKAILFGKKKREIKYKQIATGKIRIGEDFMINKTPNPQYLYAELNYSTLGKLQKIAYLPPYILVTITYADSTEQTVTAIAPILKTGVLINKKVTNTNEAYNFFRYLGKKNTDVVKIRFNGRGKYGFQKEIKYRIVELETKQDSIQN